jgi:hypothetical protein
MCRRLSSADQTPSRRVGERAFCNEVHVPPHPVFDASQVRTSDATGNRMGETCFRNLSDAQIGSTRLITGGNTFRFNGDSSDPGGNWRLNAVNSGNNRVHPSGRIDAANSRDPKIFCPCLSVQDPFEINLFSVV